MFLIRTTILFVIYIDPHAFTYMSSHGIKYRKNLSDTEHAEDVPLETDLSKIIIPHAVFLHRSSNRTNDSRFLPLSKRDPLFKALMRIEFESACREYLSNKN